MQIKKILYRNGKFISWTEGELQTQWGVIKEADLKSDSSLVISHTGKEFKVIPPNFNDQADILKRGPQTVMRKDIGPIIINSGMSKDSVVVDAGTGSGILACYLAKFSRKVVSYDIEESNLNLARKNVEALDIKNIEFRHKSIYDGIDETDVDLVVLDLAEPFRVVEHAFKSLKQGKYLVAYLPQMTQVIEFIKEAERLFLIENTLEVNNRNWNVSGKIARPRSPDITHTAFLVFCRKI